MTKTEDPRPIWAPNGIDDFVWSQVVLRKPLVINNLPTFGFALGAASALGPMLRHRRAHFFFMPSWTIEQPGQSETLAEQAKAYMAAHPRHTLHFLCNTAREVELMQGHGLIAKAINHNCLLNEEMFRPLPGVEPIYNAVYNGRLSPHKRNELACEVDDLALIYFYNDVFEGSAAAFHAVHAQMSAAMPKAHFINELTPQGCARLTKSEVNRVLAQSRVGLCLSDVEGAMFASIEYLFAGLGIVSTPSLGGRDVFFDDEFCLICEPNPRSVREAVEALVARNVPRDYVRAKTLQKIEVRRQAYIDYVQAIVDESGRRMDCAPRIMHLIRTDSFFPYMPSNDFASIVRGERRVRMLERLGLQDAADRRAGMTPPQAPA